MKKGISLIVLIITIIVIVILVAAVILTLNNNNPIEAAKEARFKEDVMAFQDELNMYIANEYTSNIQNGENPVINASRYTKNGEKNSVYTYVSSFKEKYENKLAIKNNMIAYIGVDDKERDWLLNSGIYVSKKITVNFVDEAGNKIAEPYVTTLLDNLYSVTVPKVEGYMSTHDFLEGSVTEDTELNVIYYKESADLAFIGINASGSETTDESSIVSYTVSGIGNCTSTNIAIPREYNSKPVTQIKASAFSGNSTITNLVVEDNIEMLGSNAFYNVPNLKTLKLNSKATGGLPFYKCSNLTDVEIGKNVSTLGTQTFLQDKLTNVFVYSESCFESFDRTFHGCYLLKEIKINKDNLSYKVIDGVVYSKDGSKIVLYPPGKDGDTYEISSDIKEIGRYCFYGTKLTEINIPSTVEKVGGGVFTGCTKLTNVKVDSKDVYSGNFYNCSNLTDVEIGSNVSTIQTQQFLNCSKLTNLTIYSNNCLETFDRLLLGCSSLEKINIPSENTSYTSIDGVVYSKDGSKLIIYPPGKKDESYVIPSGVKSIGGQAFYTCYNLTNVEIPNTVESLIGAVFTGCSKITSVTYKGTMDEWNKIAKQTGWRGTSSGIKSVICSDGTITL